MNLDRRALDGWALEQADFERLPKHAGYLFRHGDAWYVCHPRCGRPVDRDAFLRVIDLLRRAGPDELSELAHRAENAAARRREDGLAAGAMRLDEAAAVAVSHA